MGRVSILGTSRASEVKIDNYMNLFKYCLRGIVTLLSEPFRIVNSSISEGEEVTSGGGLTKFIE